MPSTACNEPLSPHKGELQYPIIGHAQEDTLARESLQQLSSGRGSVMLVTGEEGGGKSTFIRAIQERAGAGIEVLAARCHQLEFDLPYAPWLSLVQASSRLERSLPEPIGRESPPAQHAPEMRRRTFEQLARLAQERPMILAFDDIEWMDSQSLALLETLTHRIVEIPVLILATYRSPVDPAQPLVQSLPNIARERHARTIELQPFDESTLEALISERLSWPAAGERSSLVLQLIQLSGGNRLFVAALLNKMESNDWRPGSPRLPSTIQQLVAQRIGTLPQALQGLLEYAALIDGQIDPQLLAQVCERDLAEIVDDLNLGLEQHILVEDSQGMIEFRHGIVRQVLFDRQPMLLQRPRHARIFRALQAQPVVSAIAVARHADLAGDAESASGALAQAGVQAYRMFALPEAAALYARAIGLAEAADLSARRINRLQLAHADCLLRSDRRRCERQVWRVVASAIAWDDKVVAAQAQRRQALLFYEEGRTIEAMELLGNVIPVLELEPDDTRLDLAEALYCACLCTASLSDFQQLDQVASKLLTLSAELEDRTYQAVALIMSATASVARGQPDEAPERARESIAMLYGLGKLDIATAFSIATFIRIDLFANLHRPRMIEALINQAIELDAEGDQQAGVDAGQCTDEFCLWWFLHGEWDRARELLPNPVAYRDTQVAQVRKDTIATIAAEFAISEGNIETALDLLAYVAPAPDAPLGDHSYQQWLIAVERTISILVDAGDLDMASRWIEALDRALEIRPHVPGELFLGLSTARIHLANQESERADELLANVVAGAERTRNVQMVVNASRLRSQALAQRGQQEAAIEIATRSVRTAQSCELRYEAALSRLALAEIKLRTPELHDTADDELAELKALFRELGATAAYKRTDRLQHPVEPQSVGLTQREVEVLELVALGMKDAAISEQLFISTRTVGTHIGNMLAKTGMLNRVELTTWAILNRVVMPQITDLNRPANPPS